MPAEAEPNLGLAAPSMLVDVPSTEHGTAGD